MRHSSKASHSGSAPAPDPGTGRRGRLRVVALVAGCLAALACAIPAAAAPPRGPVVIPPISHSYDVLGAAWWHYVSAIPPQSNPLLDGTGEHCAVDQPAALPVFFLVGTFGSSPSATRACTVPHGKALFFPLFNSFDFHVACTDETAGFCDTRTTSQQVWDDLHNPAPVGLGYRVEKLHATVDGVAVGNLDPATSPYRGCSGPALEGCFPNAFSVTFPDPNLFTTIGLPLPADTYYPTVHDGFYLLLAPLSRGPHTVTFGGTGFLGSPDPVSLEVTYNLTVH